MKATLERWRKNMSDNPSMIPVATIDKPLSADARMTLADYIGKIDQLTGECNKLKADNEMAKGVMTEAKHRINGLSEEISQLKGRCTSYQLERDEAVAKCSKVEERMRFALALFGDVMRQLEPSDQPVSIKIATGVVSRVIPTPHELIDRINTHDR